MSNNSTTEVNDVTIRKQLWEGSIPSVINIKSEHITSFQHPFPYFTMIPRHSYLSLLIDKVKSHYSEFSGFDSDQLWFSFNSIAMQWHVPAGVLYDLMTILDPNTLKLPWSLTANFGSFPSDTVLRCSNEEDAQWNYLNNIKESMYIRFNSTSAMMTLSNEDQKELWSAVKLQNEQSFCKILDKVKLGAKIASIDDMVYAIRIYTPLKKDSNSSVNLTDDSKKKDVLKYKKNMICLKRDQAKQLDLQTFLNNHVIPQLTKGGYFGEYETKLDRVVIQGVEPPKDTEMLWLVENCAHPDGFLYVCCK